MPTKKEILTKLKNTYCRIKPSKFHGVGVFAIREIPKNVNPFFGVKKQRWYSVKLEELKKLDKGILDMVKAFFAMEEDGTFSIPESLLNGIDISFFMNTSKKPNVKTIDDGTNFATTKKIKRGEELTVSYGDYDIRYRKK